MALQIKLFQREINMDFKPMFDRVVIEQDDPEEKTSSGFFIPAASTEQANTGTVLAVGPGKVTKEGNTVGMTVQVKDRVMFPLGAGIKVKINGTDALVMKEDDLIAIID
jgi:chaperonin GroES